MDEGYLLAATRYIELNPVRAGLVNGLSSIRGAALKRTSRAVTTSLSQWVLSLICSETGGSFFQKIFRKKR